MFVIMIIHVVVVCEGGALLDLSLPLSPNSPTRGKWMVYTYTSQESQCQLLYIYNILYKKMCIFEVQIVGFAPLKLLILKFH